MLHEGRIAEMKTGEGKTLVATLPLYLNALAGRERAPGHGQRLPGPPRCLLDGADLPGAGHQRSGVIQSMMPDDERRAAYECDITYGTNSEFGFDYLRDNMAPSAEYTVQRGHWFAIVDEVDSILIDEARTPLIISGEPEQAAETYYAFAKCRQRISSRARTTRWTRSSTPRRRPSRASTRSRSAIGVENLYAPENGQLVNHLIQAHQGQGAVQARRRVRRDRRRGQDRRRVHRPHHGGPPLVGGAAPGGRGQGERPHPGGERDRRHGHHPELLPHVREAGRHDRHRRHRGGRVPRDLRPRGGADPDQRARSPAIDENDLIFKTEEEKFEAVADDIERAQRDRPAGAGRHHLGRGVRVPVQAADAPRRRARGAEREEPRAGGARSSSRPASRARSRSPPTWPAAASTSSSATAWSTSAACTCWAPSATSRGASTTSCAAVPAARATPARPASTCRRRTR